MSSASHLDFAVNGNVISIYGLIGIENFRVFNAAVYAAVNRYGYQKIVLDFSGCTAAFPGAMLPICGMCLANQKNGIRFDLLLPTNDKLKKLFLDANWAYLIDPAQTETLYRGYLQVPATQFKDYEEHGRLVDRVIDAVLKSVPGFSRGDLEALEWCLLEITDNVLNHSKSPIGGVVQLSNRSKARRIEFAVYDFGLGIPQTLRSTHKEIETDFEALRWSIREGVTRDRNIGQGNGLFGSSELCSGSGGFINIQSGYGGLLSSEVGINLRNEVIPLQGTLIDGCISYAHPGQLAKALNFSVSGSDFLTLKYELDDSIPRIHIKSEVDSVGARLAAAPIRVQILNLLTMAKIEQIAVDFSGISTISSSFADEVLGKLAFELGLDLFQTQIKLVNANPTVVGLINRAIQQRLATVEV